MREQLQVAVASDLMLLTEAPQPPYCRRFCQHSVTENVQLQTFPHLLAATLLALCNCFCKQALSAKAMNDKEEWVSVIGRTLSPFDGRTHPDAVLKGTTAVSPCTPCAPYS
jgi:hypothetical protein